MSREDEDVWWVQQLVRRGLTIKQADILVAMPGRDLHPVLEALRSGAKPADVFDTYAPLELPQLP